MFQIINAEKKTFVVALENGNARKLADHLQTLVIPRPVVDYVAKTEIRVDGVLSCTDESLERDQVPMHIAKHGYFHVCPPDLARLSG